ncbi:anti-sigma factor [Bacillus sp. FJAT-27445]|uniref:anti-sigma factor n=1 Tax=Bacillus sp. FJAT-27445 TaxID=1679166 RepID=UPI000743812B|nr:anti-sigma factor [Bacillus sp. FJAT-27445]
MDEWTKNKEKKILWKYRFTLTWRIVRILLAIGFLFVTYTTLLSIGYQQAGNADKNYFSLTQAINWTHQGFMAKSEPFSHAEITPFFSQKLSLPLVRTVGKKEVQIGSVDVTKRLITPFSSKTTTYTDPAVQSGFSFFLPEDPRTGKKLNLKVDPTVWSTLEKVHEGTVADFAFSTDSYYKPEDLLKLLADYNVDVHWMPIYAGELREIKDVSYSVAGGTYFMVESLGMSRARETDYEDYRSYREIGLHPDGIRENEKIMLANMEHLLKSENKSYLENVLGLRFLQERHDYLKNNGFRVYGAVVTGPVKELLKLRDMKEIQSAQVGEFAYWNWTED